MMETESGRWDQLSIETPELVAIEMPVAGLGSRFAAVLVDYLIWTAIVVGLFILMAVIMPNMHGLGEKWAVGILIFIFFLLRWGYFTLFEAFWNGRTPGKRVAKIRVIQRTGRGIGLFEAMTRNLLRFVDEMPFFYVVGVISVFCTRDHQRLGDLAAGTLVVHEHRSPDETPSSSSGRTFTSFFDAAASSTNPSTVPQQQSAGIYSAGIQKLDSRDLEVLEGFFARRLDLTLEMRAALASRIAAGLKAKSGLEPLGGTSTETFLEEIARLLRDQARIG
jgi:uncharacterized RDD family membrane protein YckC